jgi:hypothetical protein
MELLPTQFNKREQREKPFACILYLVLFQTLVLAVILCLLSALAPEITNTLADVQIAMPEMKLSVERLTYLVPEVERAIAILDSMCVDMGLRGCK